MASQLRHLLRDAEFAAFLAAAPQAGRLLRPLCRMLGIGPDPDIPVGLFQRPPAAATTTAPPFHQPPTLRHTAPLSAATRDQASDALTPAAKSPKSE